MIHSIHALFFLPIVIFHLIFYIYPSHIKSIENFESLKRHIELRAYLIYPNTTLNFVLLLPYWNFFHTQIITQLPSLFWFRVLDEIHLPFKFLFLHSLYHSVLGFLARLSQLITFPSLIQVFILCFLCHI